MAQKSPGGRQRKRAPRAVIGQDPPTIQCSRHLAGQHPVGADQRGSRSFFRRLTQDQRNGQRFGARRRCLDQGDSLGRLGQVRQSCPFDQPLIRHWRRPQRQ